MIFEWMKHKWLIFRLVLFSLMEWKPCVKIKIREEFSFGIKVWDTLFYLPRGLMQEHLRSFLFTLVV